MLERAAQVRWPWRTACSNERIHRFPLTFYAGGIAVLTALATFGFMQQARALEVQGWRLGCSSRWCSSFVPANWPWR